MSYKIPKKLNNESRHDNQSLHSTVANFHLLFQICVTISQTFNTAAAVVVPVVWSCQPEPPRVRMTEQRTEMFLVLATALV